MLRFIESFATTAENLAADELLGDRSEAAGQPQEVLRIWDNPQVAVILGRSSRMQQEVNTAWCKANGIPMFRRSSGGAAVTIGPGCLLYAVTLDYRLRPDLRMIDRAHQFVMQRLASAFVRHQMPVEFQGTCDLTWQGRKFSGNSLRCRRHSLLYHGTLLYDFPLEILANSLGRPPRQPDYRQQRGHREFVTNLPMTREQLIEVLQDAWPTTAPAEALDAKSVRELAQEKYSDPAWTGKL